MREAVASPSVMREAVASPSVMPTRPQKFSTMTIPKASHRGIRGSITHFFVNFKPMH